MPKRGKLALAACEPCRRKKVRCDGARPVCGACSDKSSQCTFSSLPGLTRTAALKSEVSQLRTNNGSLIELYWQLKHGSASDAYAIVEQIRSEERTLDVPSLMGVQQRGTVGLPTGESMASYSDTAYPQFRRQSTISIPSGCDVPNSSEDSPDSTRGAALSSLMGVKAREIHSRESATTATGASVGMSLSQGSWTGQFPPHHSGSRDALLRHSLQHNMTAIRKGFEIQRSLLSELFFRYEPKAFEELFTNLSRGPESPIASPMLCEMCAVAVTSGQYVRDLIEPGVLDYWYNAARQQLDDCIESSLVSSIKVSALLGLYNVVNKSTVAIAYSEMGLGLAATYIQQQTRHGVDVQAEELSEVLRTQKALAFCNAWLQATLGYISPTPTGPDSALKEVVTPDMQARTQVLTIDKADHSPFAREYDMVRDAVAAIADLNAKVMRALCVCSDVAGLLVSVQGLQGQLQNWYRRLPHEARLVQLGSDSHLPLKTSVYSLHLLHLGAVMLMFRHCLAGLRPPGDRETLSIEQKALMNGALSDGLVAAQQSARVVDIIGQASKSPPHCWLTIYQAYVSGMILIYHAAQLRIAGFSQEHCAKSSELAKKVVDVLEFCNKRDPVARKFFTSLLRHYEHLQHFDPAGPGTAGKSNSADPQPDAYLFAVSPEDTPLHGTSEELSRQLCNPYADESTMDPQQMTGLALTSDPSEIAQSRTTSRREEFGGAPDGQTVLGTMKPVMPNFEDGYFVGSSEPSWWLAKRTCATYSDEGVARDGL